jgi:hypothetical protein
MVRSVCSRRPRKVLNLPAQRNPRRNTPPMPALTPAPHRSATACRAATAGRPRLPRLVDDHAQHHQIVAGLLGGLAGAPRPFWSCAPHSSLSVAQPVLEAVACP